MDDLDIDLPRDVMMETVQEYLCQLGRPVYNGAGGLLSSSAAVRLSVHKGRYEL